MKLFSYPPTVNIATSRITVDDLKFTVTGADGSGGELQTPHGMLTFMCFEKPADSPLWQLEVLAHDYPDMRIAREAYYVEVDSNPKAKLAELLEALRAEQVWRAKHVCV